jgi:hypothetical protein
MEKYGVEVDEDLTKHASPGECGCGEKLDRSCSPPKCPKCGYDRPKEGENG